MNKRAFDHVLIIMFENEYRGYVMENEYMRNLAAQGIELTGSFGVMHPSQTNYIASISGELCGVNDDNQPPPLPQKTIVDLIEGSPRNLTWKAYMDSYIADDTPWKATGFQPQDHFPYVIKHNPFSSYENILDNRERWGKIDNEAGFWCDLLNDEFPEYAWFTPNMWNDGHYLAGTTDDNINGERAPGLVDQQARWLKSFFSRLNFLGPNSKLPPRTLVVVTYDEADFEAFYDKGKKYTYDGPNQIYTVLLGDTISPGQQSEGHNHYSLLRTIEKNFNLGDLQKNDRDANWFQFLWNKRFAWNAPQKTPLVNPKCLGAVSYDGLLYVASADSDGHLSVRTFDGNDWSDALSLADDCGHDLTVAANDNGLYLAYLNRDKHLITWRYNLSNGWGQSEIVKRIGPVEQIALTAIPHQDYLLLVYQNTQGQLLYRRILGDQQQKEERDSKPICNHSSGQFTLATLGPSVFLIYKIAGTGQLAALTYNSADFNKMDVAKSTYAGPVDNATVNQWSPSAFSVRHFGDAPSIITPDENEPTAEGYQAAGQISNATLDGVIHLAHNNFDNAQLVSETFSISGLLTPANPVSYDPAKTKTTSNGYGTMAQAGWSGQSAINGVFRDSETPLAIAKLNKQLWLFYQPLDADAVCMCSGLYSSVKQ